MKRAVTNKAEGFLILLCLIYSVQITPAQFVDVTAQVDVNEWSAHSMVEVRRLHVVVGTNSWRMDGDFCGNCEMTFWFTGDSIIEHTRNTQLPVTDGVELSRGEINRFVGSESTRVYESPMETRASPGPRACRTDWSFWDASAGWPFARGLTYNGSGVLYSRRGMNGRSWSTPRRFLI
jgi:hypothetical protein